MGYMKHQLTHKQGENYPYQCAVCLRTWRYAPDDKCAGLPCYYWRQSPAWLQTFSQLRRNHLRPRNRKEPDGLLWCHDAWWELYDERQATPRRRMTERQRQALAECWTRTQTKYTCAYCGGVPRHLASLKHYLPGICRDCLERLEELYERESDRTGVVEIAREILARPELACVLDTETTSLSGEPVEIAVVDLAGEVLFNSLIRPKYPVEPGARAVHGITDSELEQAPTLAEAWPDLQRVLAGRTTILTYNADFDESMVAGTARRDGLAPLPQSWHCLMEMFATWYGQWSSYHEDYKWQPLNGGHRALSDALAALDCLKVMADEHEEPSPEELLRAES